MPGLTFDGLLTAVGLLPYVPDGNSVWEFGASRDYVQKANNDYRSRTDNPGTITLSDTTFVFATPRRWTRIDPAKDAWEREKASEGKWKDVRVLDGISLEHWLGQNEAVASRVAREVLRLIPVTGARSTSEFWEEYAGRFRPSLTESVLLAGRDEQARQLVEQLANGRSGYLLQADSPEEVIAFAVAAIRTADPEIRAYLEARTIVLDSEDAGRSLAVRQNLVFLPRAGAITLAGYLGQTNATVVPLGREDSRRGNAIVLNRPTSSSLADALATMGFSEEQARQLARSCGRRCHRTVPSNTERKRRETRVGRETSTCPRSAGGCLAPQFSSGPEGSQRSCWF